MKRHLTLLGALAAVICFAQSAAAQELVRVYSPQSYAAVGTTTNYGYGVAPVYRSSNYAPATTTYYAPGAVPTTTYYSPPCRPRLTMRTGCRADHDTITPVVPTTTYYAPGVVPTTTYYAPAVVPVPYCELLRSGLLRPCVLLCSGSAHSGSARTQHVPRHDLVECRGGSARTNSSTA